MIQSRHKAGTKEYYEAELQRLRESALPGEVKKKIESFLIHAEHSQDLGYNRLRFHASNLRLFMLGMIKEGLEDKILNPELEDIERGLAFQKHRELMHGKGTLSEWSLESFKSSVKRFYGWLGFSEIAKSIKFKGKVNYKQKPDYIISQDQVDLLIRACDNARDKAIISLLFDSGMRIGELLTLRIKDAAFDDYGLRIVVSGKTGVRKIRVLGDSVGYLKGWLNSHSDPFNEDAWLFCGLGHDMRGKSTIGSDMSHSQIYSMLLKVKNRAVKLGFPPNMRINPHKFRHNMATTLSTKVSESVLEKQMGWTLASKMTRIYLHFSDESVDDAILQSAGIKKPKKESETRKTKLCMRCKTLNPASHEFCLQCGMVLGMAKAEKFVEDSTKVTDTLLDGNLIGEGEKDILASAKSIDLARQLLVVLERLKQDPKRFAELKELLREK